MCLGRSWAEIGSSVGRPLLGLAREGEVWGRRADCILGRSIALLDADQQSEYTAADMLLWVMESTL